MSKAINKKTSQLSWGVFWLNNFEIHFLRTSTYSQQFSIHPTTDSSLCCCDFKEWLFMDKCTLFWLWK